MAWTSIVHALWLFLPVYVANMSPVFTAKLAPKWSHPIDGGRMHRDGKRLLGDGKTWRGLLLGGVAAGLTAVAISAVAPSFHEPGFFAGWDYGAGGYPGGAIGDEAPPCPGSADCAAVDAVASAWWGVFAFGFVAGFVALLGDALESFVKRRTGRERGAPWFPFDQLDFVVFGLLGMVIGAPLLADGWLWEALFGDWVVLATLLVLTPGLHLLVNRVGYWIGLKEVPW